MNKCPQCGKLFMELSDLEVHLRSDTRGIVPKGNGETGVGIKCPLWPEEQIEYYASQGLFEE